MRKMIYLFELCDTWKHCEKEDLRSFFEKTIRKSKVLKKTPKEELERLNKICEDCVCDHRLGIKERLCPVCGSNELEQGIWRYHFKSRTEAYDYECIKCGRHLFSFLNLIKIE